MSSNIKKTKMSLFTIVLMMYVFTASGGYGIEDMISAAGPGMALLILLLAPIFYGAPYGLICAEMGSIYPEQSGIYVWVKRTLGDFWAFQTGWLYTISLYVDVAVYLVLGVGYMEWILGDLTTTQEILYKLVIVVAVAFINIKGIDALGKAATIMGIIVMLPFVVSTVMGFTQWQYSPVTPFIPPGQTFTGSAVSAIFIGMWMYAGFESMSLMAGEVENAQKIIPKALMIVIPFITLSYILPTISGLAAVGHWSEWATEGGISFIEMGYRIGGPILGYAFLFSAFVGSIAIYNNYIGSTSRVPFVMAEDNLFFKSLAKLHPKFSTPHISIIVISVIAFILSIVANFETLIMIEFFTYTIPLILLFVSAIVLRIKRPDMERPFKVPVGNKMFIVLAIIPVALVIAAMLIETVLYTFVGLGGIFIITSIAYFIFRKIYGKPTENQTAEEIV